MPEHSAISVASLGDLVEEQGALPGFVVQRADGLYVLRSRLDSPAAFVQFVNRVIDAGLYFHNLDYARFVELLYDEKAREPAEVFLASGVRPFDPVRRTLYHSLRADNDEATFLFEPIHALDGEFAHKNRPSGGHQHDGERIILDIDEFIAYAWAEGVRYGIDLAAVNEGFELGKPEKRVVARSLPAQAGKDAEIRELAPGLHRNNAPRRMVSGRVDLRQFETRYPQVAASLRLVQKVPRKPGIDGRLISGEVVPASPAKDFELASLAGPGTQVKREKDVEFLVSSVCGFLSVDTQTNQFSVGDKIVSHEGVSTRTTGDLLLTGEVYEQHGEIQEQRIVRCRSITAHADVFGHVQSMGGIVHLKHNLVGGSASNELGDIVVDGVASGATLSALNGCITLRRADNCVILARRAVIGQATACTIVADELNIDISEACAAASRWLHVRLSRSRREIDNVFLVRVPDLSAHSAQIATMQKRLETLLKMIAQQREKITALREEKELANYLRLADKLRRKELTLRPEQEVSWRRLSGQVAPALKALAQLSQSVTEMDAEQGRIRVNVAELIAERDALSAGIACSVEQMVDETRISTFLYRPADPPLSSLSSKELKARLLRTDAATRLLFADAKGSFAWSYQATAN